MIRDEVVVYLLYPNKIRPKKVLYIRKNNCNRYPIFNGKLFGLGGGIEQIDNNDIFKASLREINSELGFIPNNINLEFRGNLIKKDNSNVSILVGNLEKEINLIDSSEGIISLYDIDFHKIYQDNFLIGDLTFLDKLFFTKKIIKENI